MGFLIRDTKVLCYYALNGQKAPGRPPGWGRGGYADTTPQR